MSATLREAAQQALRVACMCTPEQQIAKEALRAALAQEEQEPVACFIGAKGSAFDLPATKRAYTYAEQPGNVAASKLGRSLETAKRCSAGDGIDAGLVLLKALQSEGFGVFQLGAEYTHPPRREWHGLKEWEINDGRDQLPTEDLCNWSFRQGVYFAEKALKERNNG
jgi:hypothetical protein